MAVTSNQPDFIPLLINGRPLKSLNQFYNQRRAKLQSLGKNDGWKQEVNLGKVNNQKFVTIPHARLIDMIIYQCQLSREAQLFVGWVSALRNPCGRWVSYFNPTYVHLIFNSTHLLRVC